MLDFQPVLEQDDAGSSTISLFEQRRHLEEILTCSSVAKPITRSTPARLYQLRSKITTSPAAGRCGR
jgi:hypothetical protein